MDALRALGRDVAYALRGLRNAPGFTAVAILTLALGIGANSAIFSVVNGVLLQPLPYAAPDRLMFIHSQFPTLGFDKFWISPPEFRGLQERLESFEAIGGWRTGAVNVAGEGEATRVASSLATAEFFTALGVAPILGRTYTVEEDAAGDPLVVISHGLWRRAFAGDPGIIGRSVDVDGLPRTLIGVMPPRFDIEDGDVDVWVTTGIGASPTNHASHSLNLVGRLRPGVTVAQAQAELAAVVERWPETVEDQHTPGNPNHPILARPLIEETVGSVRTALYLILGAVGFAASPGRGPSPRDRRILVYCLSGHRAGHAVRTLESRGFTRVENAGGIVGLKRAGIDVERGA